MHGKGSRHPTHTRRPESAPAHRERGFIIEDPNASDDPKYTEKSQRATLGHRSFNLYRLVARWPCLTYLPCLHAATLDIALRRCILFGSAVRFRSAHPCLDVLCSLKAWVHNPIGPSARMFCDGVSSPMFRHLRTQRITAITSGAGYGTVSTRMEHERRPALHGRFFPPFH